MKVSFQYLQVRLYIIGGDEIEVISEAGFVGIVEAGENIYAPIDFGPSPFIFQFDEPGITSFNLL